MTGRTIAFRIMFEVHQGLPREGPGNLESTARALASAQRPAGSAGGAGHRLRPGHADGGSGWAVASGARSRRWMPTSPFWKDGARARRKPPAARTGFEFSVGDMHALAVSPASVLISSGAKGPPTSWAFARRSKPGGRCSKGGYHRFHRSGLADRSDRPRRWFEWWQSGYPAMGGIQACLDKVTNAELRTGRSLRAAGAAWWDDYYKPMEARIACPQVVELKRTRLASKALEEHQREIDYYRRWSAHYGYLFVVARQAGRLMRIVSWNVNGLRACVKKGISRRARASDADVWLLQEVRAFPEQLPAAARASRLAGIRLLPLRNGRATAASASTAGGRRTGWKPAWARTGSIRKGASWPPTSAAW